jgi:hypothetical protein
VRGGITALYIDAIELLQEIEMEVSAAELTIGDGADAGVDLLLHEDGDLLVLDCAELLGGDFACGTLLAGFFDGGGAEEGTDVVGAVDTWWERHDG